MEPAASIINKLGGNTAVASIAGVHRTRVWNWTQPKKSGGTGGNIPFKYMPRLIAAAKAAGVELSADEFLPTLSEEVAA